MIQVKATSIATQHKLNNPSLIKVWINKLGISLIGFPSYYRHMHAINVKVNNLWFIWDKKHGQRPLALNPDNNCSESSTHLLASQSSSSQLSNYAPSTRDKHRARIQETGKTSTTKNTAPNKKEALQEHIKEETRSYDHENARKH